jgi:hypothetical protein
VNENEKRKERILAGITEFGAFLAAQPEVREAVLAVDIPLWRRLIISDMTLCFEEALRKNLEIADVQPVREEAEGAWTLDLQGLPED